MIGATLPQRRGRLPLSWAGLLERLRFHFRVLRGYQMGCSKISSDEHPFARESHQQPRQRQALHSCKFSLCGLKSVIGGFGGLKGMVGLDAWLHTTGEWGKEAQLWALSRDWGTL